MSDDVSVTVTLVDAVHVCTPNTSANIGLTANDAEYQLNCDVTCPLTKTLEKRTCQTGRRGGGCHRAKTDRQGGGRGGCHRADTDRQGGGAWVVIELIQTDREAGRGLS